ncbi:MAG: host-nuclease inhibitor Gam family protein [Bacteroidota bacterium]|nr:host-nuclease inhibitor Gam family protein [Bacteroidota bacterium]
MVFATFADVNYALKMIATQKAYIAKKEAEMNDKIYIIKEKYEEETIDAQREVDNLTTDVEAYCIKNKTDFEKSRSRVLGFGTVGFRNNPPKVTTLNRKYNLKTSLELVKRLFKKKYVRTKEELDKEAILADYAAKTLDDKKLAGVGLKIDQDETFFCEINWEALEQAVS